MIKKILLSFDTIIYNLKKDYSLYIDSNGYQVTVNENVPNFDKNSLKYYDPNSKLQYTQNVFESLKSINSFFFKEGIEVIYFTPTFHTEYIKTLDIDNFYNFYKEILEITKKIYDFTYIKSISNCDMCFTDINHINLSSTELIIEKYLNNNDNYLFNTQDDFFTYYYNYQEEIRKK